MATVLLPLIIAGVLCGVLFGFRSDLSSMWTRALVAGIAFSVVVGAIAFVRRAKGRPPSK